MGDAWNQSFWARSTIPSMALSIDGEFRSIQLNWTSILWCPAFHATQKPGECTVGFRKYTNYVLEVGDPDCFVLILQRRIDQHSRMGRVNINMYKKFAVQTAVSNPQEVDKSNGSRAEKLEPSLYPTGKCGKNLRRSIQRLRGPVTSLHSLHWLALTGQPHPCR